MVEDLKKETASASEQEKATAVDADEARKIQADVAKIQSECKEILDKAMPQYNKALAALDTLKAGDISEIKMYMKPKDEIKLVFEAVCLL
jgi:dynein heavy chain